MQNRLPLQDEVFVRRYGIGAAAGAPPIRPVLGRRGLKVEAGTNATRVSAYTPWVAPHWLVTGRTAVALTIRPPRNRVDRETALEMLTTAGAAPTGEQDRKDVPRPGFLGDLTVLSEDFFTEPDQEIPNIEALPTVVGGRIVYGVPEYEGIDEAMPPVTPERSPVAHFGGTRPRRKPGSGAPARPNCWARPSPSPNSTRRGGPATARVRRTTARSSNLLLPLTRRHPRPRRRLRPDRHRRTRRRLTRRVARLAARACHGGPAAGAGFWLRTGGVGCRTRIRQRTGQAQTAAQRATHWVTRRRRRGTTG
ncbi:amidohydrolase family protein [Streptomyces eurythermus]